MRNGIYGSRSYGTRRNCVGWEVLEVAVVGDEDAHQVVKSVVGTAAMEQEAELMARRLIVGLPQTDVVNLFFEDGCKDFSGYSRGMPAILERLCSANRLRSATPRRDKKVRL